MPTDDSPKSPENQPSIPVKKENDDEEKDGLIPEILKDLPPEAKSLFLSMRSYQGGMPSPLSKKITEKHIDRILELGEEESKREFKDSIYSRIAALVYVLIAVGLIVFFTLKVAPVDKDLFKSILQTIIVFAGGFGGGYGVKSYMDRNKK